MTFTTISQALKYTRRFHRAYGVGAGYTYRVVRYSYHGKGFTVAVLSSRGNFLTLV